MKTVVINELNVRKRMLDKGIPSNRQLARLLGVRDHAVGFWLSGDRWPRANAFAALCEVLDLTPNQLVKIVEITADGAEDEGG